MTFTHSFTNEVYDMDALIIQGLWVRNNPSSLYLYKFSLSEEASIENPPNREINSFFSFFRWVTPMLGKLIKAIDPQKTGVLFL